MTPEDMERAIEFLIGQQAKFAAGMQQLREEHAESYRRLGDAVLTLTGVVGRLSEDQGSLREAQEKSEQRIAELAEQGRATDARLAELTERLNAFIVFVERYIDETRNGKNRN